MDTDLEYETAIQKLSQLIGIEVPSPNKKPLIESNNLDKPLSNDGDSKLRSQQENKRRRKEYINWNEIRLHQEKVNQNKINHRLQNEINLMQIRLKEREIFNHLDELNKSKKKIEEENSSIPSEMKKMLSKNIKVKVFSKMVEKVNRDKFIEQKKKKLGTVSTDLGNSIGQSKSYDFEGNNQNYLKNNNNENKYNNLNLIKDYNSGSNSIMNKNKNCINKAININNAGNNSSLMKRKLYLPPLPHKRKNNCCSIGKNLNCKSNVEIKKPLDVKPDYLQESLASLKHNNKFYNYKLKCNNDEDLLKNIDYLKYSAEKFDEKVKLQENLIKVNKLQNDTGACEVLCNNLYNSISAKIALMKQFQAEG